jgi:aldehyde reductase
MGPKIPNLKLNSGHEIPIFGLGTWKSKPGEVTEAVKHAIDVGYRHIDGAMVYENEPEVGAALKAKLGEGFVKREELFITSKLWCTFHGQESVVPALRKTLSDLGLDYVDMYLIHWPFAFKEGDGLFPTDSNGQMMLSDVDYLETWKGMEEAANLGLAKSIGLSNFNIQQITRVLEVAKIPPATNQIEIHPYLTNEKLVEFCQEKGIVVTGYSPLGSADRPGAKPDDPKLLEDEKLIALGKKHNKSPAQVVLRWAVQRNIVTIPKSVNKKRLEENISIFDFTMSDEDMAYVSSLDRNWRSCTMSMCAASPHYPFNIEV